MSLHVSAVRRLHAVLDGGPLIEEITLRFIGDRYGAINLFHLSDRVAEQIIARPADFIRAAKKHCNLELPF